MSDGSRLRQSWSNALNDAEAQFRTLIGSQTSGEWKRVTTSTNSSSPNASRRKGKARAFSVPELSDVIVHRNTKRNGDDIYRLTLDIHTSSDQPVTLEPWKLVLSTPETRKEWDPAVQDAHILELLDPNTRICKTNFTLGWPANPRDTVTISKTFSDVSTLIDITTSLPRSPDEPAYLRPSPPFVRSHVSLFAWCIQHLPSPSPSSDESSPKRRNSTGGRIRITCFWQHDLRAVWNFGSAGFVQQLSTMMVGLTKSVAKQGSRVPKLIGYGNGIVLERINFSVDRAALTISYAIIPEDDGTGPREQLHGLDELQALKEHRRLTRAIECTMPATEGWDVQIIQKGSSNEVENLQWTTFATYSSSYPSTSAAPPPQDQILLKVSHPELFDKDSVLKVTLTIELSGPSSGWRLNGIPQIVKQPDDNRDPASYRSSQYILPEMSSVVNSSVPSTASSIRTMDSTSSSISILSPPGTKLFGDRTAAAEKSILSRVRRNYIYFSSLLQEPEAKWKRTSDARGVSVTQLDSIDPTLVVYKAEATFVGVGLWDLFGVIASPGSRSYWDKQHEDAVLLEDVNELTELWHFKTRPAWPVNGRDSVLLKTVYKSPTSIHVFFFSADDPHLFPNVPPVDPNIIRTQVDLQGWVIDALSPTTTQLTLLEQSDPKGWSNKTSIPTQMVNALAGIGDFAIKVGGPPVLTRLQGAKANDLRYDHERYTYRVEYEPSSDRLPEEKDGQQVNGGGVPVIECEIRCDLDTWAPSLDIVVDPPPQSISCLRRHKLSGNGGGLWITLTHDSIFVDDERLLVIVRKGPGKERGVVMVNGSKVAIDVEDLPEAEIKSLSKKKRTRPARIPLDQPPIMGVIRRRKTEWDADKENESANDGSSLQRSSTATSFSPKNSSPLSKFWPFALNTASDTMQTAVSAVSPAALGSDDAAMPSSAKAPMQYALDALAWAQESHSRFVSDGWAIVSEKDLLLHRKMCPEISPIIPVHKGEKIIEGVAAEELASVISASSCRKKWDDRFDRSRVLHSYGADCRTSFTSSKANFPFRDRGFYVASLTARVQIPPSLTRRTSMSSDALSSGPRNALFCVSASFSPDSAEMFDSSKYNSANMPIGRIFVDAWILETLDPYTKENYAVPSTRCTRLVAADYAGSIPTAVNTMINASLPRQILGLEAFVKGSLPGPVPVMRMPATGLLVSSSSHEDPEYEGAYTWKLRRRDDKRTLVSYYFAHEEKLYKSIMFLYFPSNRHARDATVRDITPKPSALLSGSPRPPTASPDRSSIHSTSSAETSHLADSFTSIASDATLTPLSGLPARARTPSPSRISGLPSSSAIAASAPNTPHHRQRTQSAAPNPQASTLSTSLNLSNARTGSRSPTSGFSIKATPAKDLVVAEIVIDSRMYLDEEGYDIRVKSWLVHDNPDEPEDEAIQTIIPSNISAQDDSPEETILPLRYSVYTLPSSALHSSSTSDTDGELTRHMMRATLNTSKYDIQTLEDPLTGELQSAPERPEWLLHLDTGGRVALAVDVVPRSTPNGKTSGKKTGTSRSKKRRASCVVSVNGDEVKVLDEKESLGAIGREELLPPDEGIGRWAVITRIPATSSTTFPPEFENPVGVAKDLLRPPAPPSPQDSLASTALPTPGLETATDSGVSSATEADAKSATALSLTSATEGTATNRTWMDYLAPRNFRIGSWGPGSIVTAGDDVPDTPSATETSPPLTREPSVTRDGKGESNDRLAVPGTLTASSSAEQLSGSDRSRRRRHREPEARLHRTQTLIATALIAFLIGSLMRSFVAPVDFVFVPSTSSHRVPPEVEIDGQTHPSNGQWREMKRLGEFKVKGWDLVIGAVRHHPRQR